MEANDLLREHYSSEVLYEHMISGMKFTEGAKALADLCGAYWLIDKVASHQRGRIRALDYQVWRLRVKDGSAVLTCEDGNGNAAIEDHIEFTDFPYQSAVLWVEGDVILLPSEH